MVLMVLALLLAANPIPDEQMMPACVMLPNGVEFCLDPDDGDTKIRMQCENIQGVNMCNA